MENRYRKQDIASDDDLECDDFVVGLRQNDNFSDKYGPKFSLYGDSRVDSGMGSSLESPSLQTVDKSPIQCSDTVELLNKFSTLGLDDEGINSMPEIGEVEVDLYERDEDGDTVLHVAIVNLMSEVALALIDLAVDSECLDTQNYLLQAPLHLAVLTGQISIVRALINNGANVTLRDQQGNTPLHIACRKGDRDSVSVLVQSFGSDVNKRAKYFSMKNCDGLTCVHVAAQYKEFIILGHLFAKGADVNAGDAKSGRTMLHYAVEKKDIETVSLLLTHPAIDVDCKTFKGETPLVLAYWRNYQDIVKRLKSKGASFSYDLVEDSDDDYF